MGDSCTVWAPDIPAMGVQWSMKKGHACTSLSAGKCGAESAELGSEALVELHLILGGLLFLGGCLAFGLVLLVIGLVGDLLELGIRVVSGLDDLLVLLGNHLGSMVLGTLGALFVTLRLVLLVLLLHAILEFLEMFLDVCHNRFLSSVM